MKRMIDKILFPALALLMLLMSPIMVAGQEKTQTRSTMSTGGGASSGGGYATFGTIGQNVISSRLVEGSGYTGSIGFLFSAPPAKVLGTEDPGISIKMYPVPATVWLNVVANQAVENMDFEIIGLDGKPVTLKPTTFGNEMSFDISSLNKGVYFLHISSDTLVETIKFIKR